MHITEEQWKEVMPLLLVHAKFKKINYHHIDEAMAENLVQTTIEKAIRAQDRFDGRYLLAWLKVILNNAFIDSLGGFGPESEPDAPYEDGQDGNQLDNIQNKELYDCIERLQEIHREIFLNKSILGHTYEEISQLVPGQRSTGSLRQVYRRSFVQVQDCVKGIA